MENQYRSIYKSEKHKAELYGLYDKILDNWPVPFRELDLETGCGRTHLTNCVDYRKAVERAKRLIPGVEIRIVPAAGHGLQGERPDEVNGMILDFFSA